MIIGAFGIKDHPIFSVNANTIISDIYAGIYIARVSLPNGILVANAGFATVAVAGFSTPLWLEGTALQGGLILAGIATGTLLTRAWCRASTKRAVHAATSSAEQERQRAIATADQHVAAWRAIVDQAVEGIVTIDSKGTIETVNDAAKTLFGYSRDELVGKNVKMLMPEPFASS